MERGFKFIAYLIITLKRDNLSPLTLLGFDDLSHGSMENLIAV